jgi:hypothetical protein
MGRQIRVYLLPIDAELLLNELKHEHGLRILAGTSPRPECLEVSSPITNPQRGRFDLLHFGQHYLAPKKSEIPMRWLDKQERWYVDSEQSEAIEFSPCDFGPGVLVESRFYYQIDKLSPAKDAIVPYSAEFVTWAERVFRSLKKRLRYDKGLDAYVSNEADLWAQQGGRFVPFHATFLGPNQQTN